MGEETSESGQITRPIERDRDDEGDAEGGDLPPGTRAGEYVVEERVGRGGMGSVYAARHPVLGRRAAVKVMAADLVRDVAFVRRFVEEARAQSRIQHPNIAESFSFGQLDDGRCYYAMEWLDGETLSARLRRGPMSLAEIIAVLDGVADALEAIHAGSLVHREAPLIAGRGGLPAAFERLVAAMLERAPARRPDLAAIRGALAGLQTRRPPGRWRRLGLGVGAVLLAGGGAVAIAALASGGARRGEERPTAAPASDPAARPPPRATPAAVAGQEAPPPSPSADAAPPPAPSPPPPGASADPPAPPRPPATRRRAVKRPTPRAPVEFVPQDDPDYLLEPKPPRR